MINTSQAVLAIRPPNIPKKLWMLQTSAFPQNKSHSADREDKGDASTIFRILDSLKSADTRQLDEYNYSLGISSCAKSTMWQHALGLFRDIPEAKVPWARHGNRLSLDLPDMIEQFFYPPWSVLKLSILIYKSA